MLKKGGHFVSASVCFDITAASARDQSLAAAASKTAMNRAESHIREDVSSTLSPLYHNKIKYN